MPRKPRRGCAASGCPRLAVEGSQYCEEHKKQAMQQYNQHERSPDSNKKYGRAWKRIRDRYVAAHPLCERCLKEGRLTPVEEVHHILPVSQGGDHRESNLMSLCQSCHKRFILKWVIGRSVANPGAVKISTTYSLGQRPGDTRAFFRIQTGY